MTEVGYFLDTPAHRASERVLRDSGVTVDRDSTNGTAVDPTTCPPCYREFCFASATRLACPDGQENYVFDIRDSADAWIRVTMTSPVVVSAETWMRIPHPRTCPIVHASVGPIFRFEHGSTDLEVANKPYYSHPGMQSMEDLVCDLCRALYHLGWASGTGGSISIRHGTRTFMAPSGVQKERLLPQDIFVLDSACGVLYHPPPRFQRPPFKLSECAPLFSLPFTLRGAGACIHSHHSSCVMASLLYETEFTCTHLEMMKGIAGHTYHDELVVPIINNTARECELVNELERAIQRYPKTSAVLVRRHGVYVWGPTWEKAKSQAECYHYLFDAALRMKSLGIDPGHVPAARTDASMAPATKRSESADESPPAKRQRLSDGGTAGTVHQTALPYPSDSIDAVVLDVEGTTTPVSFVRQVLYDYAVQEVGAYAREHATDATVTSALRVAEVSAPEDDTVQELQRLMRRKDKDPAIKQLETDIWAQGYRRGDLVGELFEDVPFVLRQWVTSLKKDVYTYSSGSSRAQRLLFEYTRAFGNLTPFLADCLDPSMVGGKTDPASYATLCETIHATDPARVLFVSDRMGELRAAAASGLRVACIERLGNVHEDDGGDTEIPRVKSLAHLIA